MLFFSRNARTFAPMPYAFRPSLRVSDNINLLRFPVSQR
jgi:hypothetical protein